MTRRWFEIAIPVSSELVDEASALLDVNGFGGVEVRELADRSDVVVVIDVEDDGRAEPVDLRRSIRTAHEAVRILGCGEPCATELDPKVWTENWKQHFARRTFAGRIEVRPPWEHAPPEDSGLLPIVINPGMAFGTGLHETTAACLELLVEQMKPGMRVADVGCGSGILAIAAARLGASSVLATDVDPLAVDATRENIAANAVEGIVEVELEPGEVGIPEWEPSRPGLSGARQGGGTHHDAHRPEAIAARANARSSGTPNGATCGGFSSRGERVFDLVIANILAETLVEMRSSLAGAVRDGGVLVMSGIEGRRLKMVEEAFIRAPWCLVRTVTKGDWVSICLHNDLAEPARRLSVPDEPGAPKKTDLSGVA